MCVVVFLTMLLFATGCSKRKLPEKIEWLDGHRSSEREMADACMEQIVNLINSEDKEGLLGLISDNARDEVGESVYEQGIETLFLYFDGEIEKFEADSDPNSSRSSMMGVITLNLTGYYRVYTEQTDYWIVFGFCPRNDKDEGEIGIIRIIVTTDEIAHMEEFYWDHVSDPPGIYFISEEDFSPEAEDTNSGKQK